MVVFLLHYSQNINYKKVLIVHTYKKSFNYAAKAYMSLQKTKRALHS